MDISFFLLILTKIIKMDKSVIDRVILSEKDIAFKEEIMKYIIQKDNIKDLVSN